MNHRLLPGLGQRTPIEVHMGRTPKLPIELAIWKGHYLKDAENIKATPEMVNEYMDELVSAFSEIHTEVKDKQRHRYNLKLARQKQKG